MDQINAAIQKLKNAKSGPELINAQIQALSFTKAAFEIEKISKTKQRILEKKIRRIYREQLIEEAA